MTDDRKKSNGEIDLGDLQIIYKSISRLINRMMKDTLTWDTLSIQQMEDFFIKSEDRINNITVGMKWQVMLRVK